jgi:putative endonuclease
MALFYILYSRLLDRYYIGHTEHTMDARLQKHLSDHQGWSGRAKDWKVVHVETWASKALAMQREREVKGWKKRLRIEALFVAGPERPA